ncbi:hypothetical protein DESUT3_15240 [Desulfuromonas versatilis]|uniref:IS1595 family transposase n=1 Tax=Desulfuromonas versatilis TaxID=2802975 RepID=A0ABN6DWK7_9BACT|nr:hypothetical protein [Desulfuromonas versatilis]BCR04455.1 hypothetical protein DESUT3_15240 [Desulfuromonas versatilis]
MDQRPSADPPCCPHCHFTNLYRLGDGRRKCGNCGRKFTLTRLRSRLPDRTLRLVAICFWHMIPASRVADDLALNPKTVQRHYRLLRQAICTEDKNEQGINRKTGPWERPGQEVLREVLPCGKAGGGSAAGPVFALKFQGSRARIHFSPAHLRRPLPKPWKALEGEADALFYAGSIRALERVELEDFFFATPKPSTGRSVSPGPAREVLVFWDFARRLQKHHRGRAALQLESFFGEVVFRFNNRDNPEILQLLCMLLKNGGLAG